MRFKTFSYRFADQILNSNYKLKSEIEAIVNDINLPGGEYKRKELNAAFRSGFVGRGWQDQFRLFEEADVDEDQEVPVSRIDFMKERVGVEVAFAHESFIGIDMLKFQVLSYSSLNKIDVGVYIVATSSLRKISGKAFRGSITFEKVEKYLPHFKSAIQVPVLAIGLLP